MGKLSKGLNRDANPVDQPEGTWRYAKNAIVKRDFGGISNEAGTDLGYGSLDTPITSGRSLSMGYKAIGKIEIESNINIIFSYNAASQASEIGYWDGKDSYIILLRTSPLSIYQLGNLIQDVDLKFNDSYPIRGMYKYNSDNELIIYWTDNHNIPRYLNVDQQKKSSNILWLYDIDPSLSPNPSYINMMRVFPHSGPVPDISYNIVAEGGACLSGTYQLALSYQDDYSTRTNYTSISQCVYVIDDTGVTDIEHLNGCPPGTQTGKSIVWNVGNLNTDYKYIKPVVIFRTGYNSPEVFELDLLSIRDIGGITTVSFSGLENVSTSSLQEILVDYVAYDYIDSLTHLDHKAYFGNLRTDPVVNYQKYANFIKLKARTETFDLFEPVDLGPSAMNDKDVINQKDLVGQSYAYPHIHNHYKGYMRGEVYAFYIAFIKNDGNMSRAFHIPGRPTSHDLAFEFPDYVYTDIGGTSTMREDDIYDSTSVSGSPFGGVNSIEDISQGGVQEYETMAWINNLYKTNYWENKDERYPNTEDYTIVDAEIPNPTTFLDILPTLKSQNVRHHHFPKNQNITGNIHGLSLLPSSNYTAPNDSTSAGGEILCATTVLGSLNGSLVWQYGAVHYLYVPKGTVSDSLLNAGQAFGTVDIEFFGVTYQRSFTWTDNSNNIFYDVIGFNGINCGNAPTTTAIGALTSNRYLTLSSSIPLPSCYSHGQQSASSCPCSGGSSNYWYSDKMMVIGNTYTIVEGFSEIKISWTVTTLGDYDAHHKVKPLGFELHDLKIPQAIADEVQGFKIYYARRTHEEKTVLGQSLALPMINTDDYDYTPENTEASAWATMPYTTNSTFLYGNGFTYDLDGDTTNAENAGNNYEDTIVEGVTFHDFGLLLNNSSIVHAHYLDVQFEVNFMAYRGVMNWGDFTAATGCSPGPYYESVFFWNMSYANVTTNNEYMNHPYLIADNAISYIPSRSIFRPEGQWGRDFIHNIGGESCIAMRLDTPMLKQGTNYVSTDVGVLTGVADQQSKVESDWLTGRVQGNHYLYLANLKTLKRNVYEGYDSRTLVDTGYEVIGSDLDKFIVKDDNTPLVSGSDFQTDHIFGGDTTIHRYSVRSTMDNGAQKMGGVDYITKPRGRRALYSFICESSDNISFRHSEGIGTAYFPLYSPKALLGTLEGICLSNIGTCTSTQNYEPCECLDLHGAYSATHPGNALGGLSIATGAPEGHRYNPSYSLGNDLKNPIGYKKYFREYTQFPNRIIRSIDDTSITDGFRLFEALEYKDIPRAKREITNLYSINNLIYIQTKDSIYKTQGKQTMETSDGGSAFIGSGDIFKQEPLELIQTDQGYGGNQFKYSNILTRYGYFWVNYKSSRIFLYTDQIEDIGGMGLNTWFLKNIPYSLTHDYYLTVPPDNPYKGMGFHATYDEKYRRILLTKRERIFKVGSGHYKENENRKALDLYYTTFVSPDGIGYLTETQYDGGSVLLLRFNSDLVLYEVVTAWTEYDPTPMFPTNGDKQYTPETWTPIQWDNNYFFKKGHEWTISYQADYKVWISFHDYTPDMYISSSTYMSSLVRMRDYVPAFGSSQYGDQNIYVHDNSLYMGLYYGAQTNVGTFNPSTFEIGFVDNQENESTKLYSTFYYVTDVHQHPVSDDTIVDVWDTGGASVNSMGFTSFYVYNRNQMSGEIDLQYLNNARNALNTWNVNGFRDMATVRQDTRHAGTEIYSGETWISTSVAPMNRGPIVVEGMAITPNQFFIDPNKEWNQRKKFIDKYLNIHLICSNSENLLVTLYSMGTTKRISYR